MLITDKEKLKKYSSQCRLWQGIPSVEITEKGRIFVSFYSGEDTEKNGNYSVLVVSEDGGASFSEPIAAVDVGSEARAYDSCLWIDPLGRLWYIWSVMPDNRVEFSLCNDPDAQVLEWSEIRVMGGDVMLNKPTVTSSGAWLFPLAVWKDGLTTGSAGGADGNPTGAHVYESRDCGESFTRIGTVKALNRWFDEHMLLEKKDGSLEMYIRTTYGIARSASHDGGRTWEEDTDSGFGGPNSRFYIGRLSSGNVLLVNHYRFAGRSHITALLSRDDGNTFEGKLLLDERHDVSYPDVKEHDGYIYVVYDRERGARYREDKDYTYAAREILMARITEADIMAGELVSPRSELKHTVSKLRPYEHK